LFVRIKKKIRSLLYTIKPGRKEIFINNLVYKSIKTIKLRGPLHFFFRAHALHARVKICNTAKNTMEHI